MLKLFGMLLLAFGACAFGMAVFGLCPVHPAIYVSLMCSGLAWAILPWIERAAPTPAPAAELIMPVEAARKIGSVARFMSDRLTRADGHRAASRDLFEAYRDWCEAKGLAVIGTDEFEQRLADLCDAAGIRRSKGRALMNVSLA